jgi:LmbE family N-acetylglucosaminyl deacetylase
MEILRSLLIQRQDGPAASTVTRIPVKSLYAAAILLTAFACGSREDIRQYAAVETYPDDTLLRTVEPKRAMIVLAHDDDMCALAGTASLLNRDGWEIAVVSLAKTPERDSAQARACRRILDTAMFVHLTPAQVRNDDESQRQGYYAFPKDSFGAVFNTAAIADAYAACISSFRPAVIFSLDNEMGGYGHPEHVLISQMVIDLSREKRIGPLYIYQSVYTRHMETRIMQRHSERMKSWGFPGNEWEHAKHIYGAAGMPEPDVQIRIAGEAKPKMDYLRSYNKRERKTIGFFVPEFERYSAETYFAVFDREFFRIIRP